MGLAKDERRAFAKTIIDLGFYKTGKFRDYMSLFKLSVRDSVKWT